MKVGIITFHFAHNQGAVLQCYALQKVLEDSGHSPYVIDYRPAYHAVRYTARKNPFVLANNSWKKYRKSSFARRVYLSCRGFARGMVTLVKPSDKTREKNFEAFINKHLALTARFSSLGKLKKHAPAFDAYISGSDQLWNPELLDGNLDPAYFLNFGSDSVRRITFAISQNKPIPPRNKRS